MSNLKKACEMALNEETGKMDKAYAVSLIDGHIDRPMTNYELIKKMSVDEMARFITDIKESCTKRTMIMLGTSENAFNTLIKGVEVTTKEWLEAEVETE